MSINYEKVSFKMSYLVTFVYLVPLILVIQYAINRIAATKSYNAYYKEQRQKYQWLDKWIKDNNINPASTRGNSAANSPILWIVLAYVLIAGIGGTVANFIIGGVISFILDSANVTPPDFVEALYSFGVGQTAAIITAVIVSQRMWNQHVKFPSNETTLESVGLTLECPKCHCPHSWVMTFSQDHIKSKHSETTTTTRVRESDGDTKRTEYTKHTYFGKTVEDFMCLNCDHTEHKIYDNSWDNEPSQYPVDYNPPLPAWKVTNGMVSNIINVAVIIVMFGMANTSIDMFMTLSKGYAEMTKGAAAHEEAAAIFEQYNKAYNAKDNKKAVEFLIQSAEKGHLTAQYNLGLCYRYGELGVEKNYAKAIEWFEKAQDSKSCIELGIMYRDGIGVEKNGAKAVKWFKKSDSDEGALNIALMYRDGISVKRNFTIAGIWFKTCNAEKNYNVEWEKYLKMKKGSSEGYSETTKETNENAPKASKLAKSMSKPRSMSESYKSGVSAYKAGNYAEAVELFTEAANKGHISAQFNLGVCYYKGEGVPKDFKKAMEWYEKAARNDNYDASYQSPACIEIGKMYRDGEGVKQDFVAAESWLRKGNAEVKNKEEWEKFLKMKKGK